MSIVEVYTMYRCLIEFCKAREPGAAAASCERHSHRLCQPCVFGQRPARDVGLADQQHRVVGMGETRGFTGRHRVHVWWEAGTEFGRMWLSATGRFWYAAHTQEVWPPWLQTYVYLEMYSKISVSFLIWFVFRCREENHRSREVGGFVWFPSQQKLKTV